MTFHNDSKVFTHITTLSLISLCISTILAVHNVFLIYTFRLTINSFTCHSKVANMATIGLGKLLCHALPSYHDGYRSDSHAL